MASLVKIETQRRESGTAAQVRFEGGTKVGVGCGNGGAEAVYDGDKPVSR